MEGDRRAEARPYKGMSQTKVKPRMYASKLLTERSPVAKCVMIAEASTDAPDSFCGASDGTGHRDMARSDSSARELGRSAAAKAGAEVGGNRSSVEAGNDRGAKGSCIESASNRSAGADSLRRKRMTEEGIASIAAKHRMAKFPNLALTRERLSRKAKAEPKFRFYTLYGRVMDMETLRCAWRCVRKAEKAPGVDGVVACAREPNGVMENPKGRVTPQGGIISPLLSNIYLHWFETIATLTAKAMGQAMAIVRYADDFVILEAHGEVSQQEEPAALPAEVRGFVLRRTCALRPPPPCVGGREEDADLTGKKCV